MLAQSGECVAKKCVSKSLVERVNEALRRTDEQGRLVYVDLAIILGGTNDIFHDVSAAQITAGLSSMHWLLWTQPAPAPMPAEGGAAEVAVPFALPKTLAVSIPQFGSDASWRLKNDASKRLPSEVRADVNQHLEALCGTRAEHHQCTYVDLDRLTPRWGVPQENVAKYWADEVHFNSLGYDRLAQRLFDIIKPMLPDEDN
jgi:lysophospholipase L1-like esterase